VTPRARAVALGAALALAGCRIVAPSTDAEAWRGAVTVVAAGDIADCRRIEPAESGAARTARLIEPTDAWILTLGDHTYPVGAPAEFSHCFDPTWGRFGDRLRPAPGNHDYGTPGAAGYYCYFGERAGPPGRGYYAFRIGEWHVVALNSNVAATAGSPQHRWLIDELRASGVRCTLAYWHHPVFSSGPHGNDARMRDALAALHAAGAEIVLVAHDHVYERLAPHDATGAADASGVRAFTVGTGGARLYAFTEAHPLSEVRDSAAHGVLRLTLGAGRYRWAFVGIEGAVRDAGEGACR
jgi:3',5'-cyclic AMP phosphodiesterase CpdA